MDTSLDRLTDHLATGLSLFVAVSLWAMFLYDWFRIAPRGEITTQWLLWAALLLTMLSCLTLFGTEKVSAAISQLGGGGS